MNNEKEVKVQYIEGNGNYETFQRYAWDPYLGGKTGVDGYLTENIEQKTPSSKTLRSKLLTKTHRLAKLLAETL